MEHPAFQPATELAPLLAEKGSIAVSGVSLTVTAVSAPGETPAWFEVGLIPETLKATNLGALKVGDSVNLETDALAKYVQRLTAFAGVPQATLHTPVSRLRRVAPTLQASLIACRPQWTLSQQVAPWSSLTMKTEKTKATSSSLLSTQPPS